MFQSCRKLFTFALAFCLSIVAINAHATAQDGVPYNQIALVFLEGDVPQDITLPPTVTRAAAWGLDIFVGGEIDLVGIFWIELGGGLVLDLDTPLDSGIYICVGVSGGLNVGAGVGGGIARGDIEGNTGTLDVNVGPGSGVIGLGEDGSVVFGGSVGP